MGKIGFVFAGQGAQYVGMGKDLYESFPAVFHIFDMLDENLRQIMWEGPALQLNRTENTQPCLFAVDLACATLLCEAGIFPKAVAGFSLGEIPALAFGGILSLKQAYELACIRAKLMQESAEQNKGAMLAVLKLSADEVKDVCRGLPEAFAVNYNCPGQTVVATSEKSLPELREAVAQRNGKAVPLSVSGAFHSPFMDEASRKLGEYLSGITFGEMKIPIYSNVTANIYSNPAKLIAMQVNSPVLWQTTIENMIADGIDTFIEVGAGKTLSGLIKKINADVKTYSVYDCESLKQTVSEVENG